ncbi:SLOG family protein [Nocardia wallacei]|uniref:SLOG family protein n=1 Tax=Nocardia wallacei TaxID=480035 RepID=UPI003CC7FA50
MINTLRLLVTGSRDWTDRAAMRDALATAWRDLQPGPIVLVHGAAEGADLMAAEIWTNGGLPDEPHPADWDICRPECDHPPRYRRDGTQYCQAAGGYRNQEMVDAGADLLLAFPMPGSRGTWDCLRRAKIQRIPWRVIEVGSTLAA